MKRIILLLTFLLSAAYFYAQECVIVIPQLNGDTISVGMNSIKYIQAIQGGTVLMESEGAGTYTTSMSFDAVNAAANNRYLKYTDASSLRVYGIAVSNVKRILKASSGNAVILTKNGNYSFLTVEPYSTISGRGADCITIGVDAGVLADSMALLYAYVDANVGLSESEVASLVSDSIALINVMDTRLVQDTILEYYLDDLLVGKDTIRSKVPVAGDILATDAGGFFMTSPKNLENILQEMGDSLLQHLIRIQIMETLKMDAAEVRAIVSDTSQVLMARDTVSKLYRDSVLRYYLDGVVVGQDTIRPPGSGGGGGSSNSIYVISSLSDTTTIVGEIEGDIAYVADTLMALRDDLYWLPFAGGGSGGSGLNESQVVAIVGDSSAVLRQLDTTSMIIQDSILVYRLQGIEVGRDTIRDSSGGGLTSGEVATMIGDSLVAVYTRDTVSRMYQDSILRYWYNGSVVSQDTIRTPYQGGLNSLEVATMIGDSLVEVYVRDTVSRMTQDSILQYWYNGSVVSQDTIRDHGITRTEVGEMIKDSLSISELRDTITNLIQDSILVYMLDGIEKGRDTIRVPGSTGVTYFKKIDSYTDLLTSSANNGDVFYSTGEGGIYYVQADTIAGYLIDSIVVTPLTGGNYAVLKELVDKDPVDVRKLGISANTSHTNLELQVLTRWPNKIVFPRDTFIFRNWQVQNTDKLDVYFDNTIIKLPTGSTVDVYNDVGTTNFDVPQITIVNCKNINLEGHVVFDHSDATITWIKPPTTAAYAGIIHIVVGTEFTDYGNIEIKGATFKNSYFLGIRVESPSAWINLDSTSYKNVVFDDIHCDFGTGLVQTRVTAENIALQNSSMFVDVTKGYVGVSDLEKPLGFTLDVNSEVKTSLLISNFRSRYGGYGFYQNIHNVKIENVISDKYGYFYIDENTDGNIVTASWKAANPGLWDPLTMIEYNGGPGAKIDNYYYKPGRVFVFDNIETRNTSTFAGTTAYSLQVEAGNENLMMTDSYIDADIKFSNPLVGDGLSRKAMFTNSVFTENSKLWVSWGTTFNNCAFRDTVTLATSGSQELIDENSAWKGGVLATTTGNYERVRFNDCVFTNRGLTQTAGRLELNNCKFEGKSEINYGGLLTNRAELIARNCSGGRYRQSLAGTSDSLEIRFINHDRLGIGTTTFNNLQNSPFSEVTNCTIINYDSTAVADLITTIDNTLTNRSHSFNPVSIVGGNGYTWGNSIRTEIGTSVSSGSFVVETDIPFTNSTYFMMRISFYRYASASTYPQNIGKINIGSYLASLPDFYNPQGITMGDYGGTDQIKFAVNGSGFLVIIIGDVGDSYGSYPCHFVVDEIKYTNDTYAYDMSNWIVKSDSDISEYTVKKTLTGTFITSNVPVISDTPYDATSWNGNLDGATKNAIRDKIELLAAGGSDGNGIYDGDGTAPADLDIAVTDSISIDNGTLFVNGITNKVGIANATPSEALDVTGNIAVSGTVDGRDLATDGSKLDGIEAGADVTDEANVVSSLNGATLTGVTVAGTDKVIIQDVSDSDNIKTVTAQSIADLASGSGDVVGPASSNDFEIAVFDGTTGKLLKTSAARASVAGDLSSINNLTLVGTLTMPAATNINMSGGGNIVLSGTGTVDGRDVATDGSKLDGIEAGADVTDATNVESAGALMDSEVDADIKTLNLPASTTISAFGASLVDDADAATARGTLGVDAAGTDNSTNVTLTGTGTYLSLLGQQITVDPITESDITDLNHFDGAYGSLTGTPTIPTVSDVAYDATSWDGNTDAATKNAIRDKIELLAAGGSDGNGIYDGDGTAPADLDVAVTDSINFGSGLLFIDGVNDKVEVSEALQINASTNSGSVETFKILNSVATPTVRGLSNGQFELKTSTSYWWKFNDNTLQLTNWGGTIQPMNIVSGTITAQYSGIKLANGSASAPSFAFYNGSGTGMYYPAANTIGFSMANANYVTFGINQTTFRNYVFNSDQTVGSGQDGYALIYNDGSGEIELTAIPGGGSPTSLSTGTVDATTYGISSDGGTDDVVLVEATTTTAGLLGAAKWNEIVANTAKVSNVNTSLSTGNITATTYGITSDGGTDDVVLAEATTTTAGLLGAAKWNEIVANTAKVSNVSTSLSTGTVTATTYGITSDGGANDVVLAEATTTTAGLLGASKWNEIVTNTAKISNATHTGEVTGATTLTVDKTAISNRTAVTAASTDYVLIGDASDSGNLKKALVSDLQDGTGTDDQTATEVSITDSGGYYSGSTVEAALDELGEATVPFSTSSVTTGVIDWENKTDGVRFIDMTGLSTVTISFSNAVVNGKYTIIFQNADDSDTITWTTDFINMYSGLGLSSAYLASKKRAFQVVYNGTNFYVLSSY